MQNIRTDLAVEAHELSRREAKNATEIDGVISDVRTEDGITVTNIEITNENGSKALGKAIGNYITIESPNLKYSIDIYERVCTLISEEIRKMTSLYNYQKRETENLRLKGENDRMQIRIYRILSLFGLGLSITLLFIYRLKRQKERLARQFEALQREKQEQYERSFQYVEANNVKLNELGTLLSKDHEDTNSLLHVRKELLQVTNEQIQLRRTERDLLESDLRHSDIYMKFHSTNEADQIIREEDWNALRKELDKTYNNFTNRLYQLYSGMSLIELRICYLIKISVKVTDMAKILGRSKPSVSSSRKRLYKKIKGEDGTPNELDELIAGL